MPLAEAASPGGRPPWRGGLPSARGPGLAQSTLPNRSDPSPEIPPDSSTNTDIASVSMGRIDIKFVLTASLQKIVDAVAGNVISNRIIFEVPIVFS